MSDIGGGSRSNDVAIVGMALRVPGARTCEEFWSNLRGGVESIEERTVEQLVAAGESREFIRRKNYVPRTAMLPGMAEFDAGFFGMSPKDAAIMDPQHRQFLECAWEAMETAGRPPESIDGPVGVFAGCGMGSYFYFNVCSHARLVDQVGMFLLRHTGNDKDFLTTRASYLFDLRGPSVNVQTACSTSLVALHYACQSLLAGECDMALAGGATIELPHGRGYLYQDGEILSPDGHCRAFDHRSAGTVFGSGAGVLVLRRLADAIADGDTIRAVIKSTAINNDGAGKASYLAPSINGQAEAIVEAHVLADISADTIQYVECHGTGTALGDPIEVAALTEAFRNSTDKTGFCRIGSVKTNIGHLDTAAGVASVIKTVLAMEHGEIPANLGYEAPNPAIDFGSSPFVVNDRLTPWPQTSGPRRAGVNSLGVGGTNAHVILEEAPRSGRPAVRSSNVPRLFVLSAKSRQALDQAAQQLGRHIERNPDVDLADIAFTLAKGRKRFEHRRVYAVRDRDDAIAALTATDSARGFTHTPIEGCSGAVLMFPGGGAQYPGMGSQLYRHEKLFSDTVDAGLAALPSDIAGHIRRVWLDAAPGDRLAAEELLRPSLQLPAILILEVAIARLLESSGLRPTALIGHSMGEYAAACCAGVMSLETAARLVLLRGQLFESVSGGEMVSIQLPADKVAARLPAGLDIAVVNAPELTVVSGPMDPIRAFREDLKSEGIEFARVPINVAAHSRMLEPILDRFETFLKSETLATPRIAIVSNLTGGWLTPEQATDPAYWVQHLRSTVRFADGLALLAADKARVYIEAGPGRGLSSLAKAQGCIAPNAVINTLPHSDEKADDQLYFRAAVGRGSAVGLDLPIERTWADATPKRVVLPTYPFQHQAYFLERVEAQTEATHTPEKRPDIANWGWLPVWKPAYADTTSGMPGGARSFLIFLDDAGVGDILTMRLRSEGHRVTTVSLGDAFAKVGEEEYLLCPEQGREGYDKLVGSLSESGGIPDGIVHLWLVTLDEDFRMGSSFFHRNQERGFWSLLYLGQAFAAAGAAENKQLTVLTNGMQRLGSESVPYPEKATVLGPVQVIPREMPSVHARAIDVPVIARKSQGSWGRLQNLTHISDRSGDGGASAWARSIVDLIVDDVFAKPGDEIVVYRNGRRYVRTHEEVILDNATHGMSCLRQQGTYLLTGGLGDLAATCAIDLAKRFRARIALVGRMDLPPRSTWARFRGATGSGTRISKAISTIERIEEEGGEVIYLKGDVTNIESMQRIVSETKQRFGSIHGVFHAAGLVKDGLIQLKTTAEAEDVLAPKVLGTLVLDRVFAGEALDLFVLFSSTSTDTAPAGQVDYVAANAFLNAFAESKSAAAGPKVVAVHWGVWSDVGLAHRAIRGGSGHVASRLIEPALQPLLDIRSAGSDDGSSDEFELNCSTSRDWLLDEHRLASGEAVWPGTGYLELFAEVARELGIAGALGINDLTFLRPLYVEDGQTRTIRIRVDEGSQQTALYIESSVPNSSGPIWVRHAAATVRKITEAPQSPTLDLPALVVSCERSTKSDTALASAQEAHLRFGPRWRVLRELHLARSFALARLRLDDRFLADIQSGLVLHPALMDIATGFAMELIPGYDAADGLWVPASYTCVNVYAPMRAEIWSRVTFRGNGGLGDGFAAFDAQITDIAGNVLCEVEGLILKHLGKQASLLAPSSGGLEAVERQSNRQAAATDQSPAMARLAAQVEQGIAGHEGFDALLAGLGVGSPQVVISSLDLCQLKADASKSERGPAPPSDVHRGGSQTTAQPSTEVERRLAEFWTELLGVERPGVDENFFDLGGHSLVAVRLFGMMKKTYGVDLPISVLFEAPTIGQCARIIEQLQGAGSVKAEESDGPGTATELIKFTHLVPMLVTKRRHATPLFVCAGMFGNILNLRHLAMHVGQDRPVYGLQARGLYGDQLPHESFEEMARANLEEVRQVQPQGPYLLAGFSGGGIVAYEMARLLVSAGEQVGQVVLLDTPYPTDVPLSLSDRITMRLQDIQREKGQFATRWLGDKIEWSRKQRLKALQAPPRAEDFHNDIIQMAFLRSLAAYSGHKYGGRVLLLRPPLNVSYTLRDGRLLNSERSLLREDNGWRPFVDDLKIVEVPGDHDSMILEPNVRVLANYLRQELRRAERMCPMMSSAAE